MPPKQNKQVVYKAKQPNTNAPGSNPDTQTEATPGTNTETPQGKPIVQKDSTKDQGFAPQQNQYQNSYQQKQPGYQAQPRPQFTPNDEHGYNRPKYQQRPNQNDAASILMKDLGGITPQMLAQTPHMLPHLANLQQMDQVELESLVLSLIDKFGGDILNFQGRQNQNQRVQSARGRGGQQQPARGGYRPFGDRGFPDQFPPHSDKRQGIKLRQDIPFGASQSQFPSMGQNYPPHAQYMPRPKVYQAKQKPESENETGAKFSAAEFDVPNFELADQDVPIQQSMGQPQASQSQHMPQQQFQPNFNQMGFNMFGGHSAAKNLCQKHFPEPIILFLEGPKCKKCIPEQVALKFGKAEMTSKSNLPSLQTIQTARMLGLNSLALNMYQTEKSQISRSLERLNMFRRELRNMQEDIKERDDQSKEYLEQLPPLMNSMFEKLEELVKQGEARFKNKIFQIVRNQQKNIQDDMKTKLPQFYQRLVQKYSQLQQASNLAQQKGAEELIQTLKHYLKIFNELDAEYEKYFNDYEKMSKLQRLLDKDANEIVDDFNDLVDRNLRVDYNIKNSFGPHLQQRLHSFQWNQRCSQIYRIKTGQFEKKPVQMQYEVPLYSRSIATETGTIYLIGGFIKQANIYLKSCHRYDEIFGILQPVAQMQYPHADHSVCSIQGFIYVVGTFVNNQVYGWCEVYDTQKDKWKTIDEMRVPRTGVSLCTFKNNYIFAFGGRIDQKRIVDTIEVYDISRNVWQEIDNSQINKMKWVPAYMGLAYQITDNEIILFGGKSAITFQIFNGCFVFDVEKMEIKERGSLINPCSFMNTPLVFNNSLYAYGNDVYVHCYNIPEHKWSAIPKSSVVLPKS